ncbi:hypothetical protein R3Q06_12445 [Rhodococcus erythropolis]|uniref:hypothetical protein n=1 Tax=Rhodococcus erythropolis TaxID=1833 RepID=UPI00294A4951|nr:hypothetical protein [Rhodococcus erythropolis]MDV6274313.1 hypothetical protein [Rhodococcus erythropolis]
MTIEEYKAKVDAKYARKPDRHPVWLIFDPQGRFEGVCGLSVNIPNVESAHKRFTPLECVRLRELAEGYVVRLAEPGEWERIIEQEKVK